MRIRRKPAGPEDEFVNNYSVAKQERQFRRDEQERFPRRISLVTTEEIIVSYLFMRCSA